MEKRLIVCADDFGLTCGVNQGIIDCHRYGILKSASVLAKGPAFDHGIMLASQFPGLDLGIHLYLTEFKPVSRLFLGNLTDKNERFLKKYIEIVKQLIKKPEIIQQIKGEFRCQIEYLLKRGIQPSHINSHKHLHAYPSIWKIVLDLALEYKIAFVRCPVEKNAGFRQNLTAGYSRKAFKNQLVLLAFNQLLSTRFVCCQSQHESIKIPDYFYGLFDTGYLNECNISNFLVGLKPGITELMCHPGYVDHDLLQMPTRLLRSREKEVAALCHSGVKKIVNNKNIKVVSFHECYTIFNCDTCLQ